MRKLFLSIAMFVMAICASAQTNQYFWYQGNLMLGTQIAQIDSVTFGDSESVDTLHLLLPRTIIKTVEVHDTTYIIVHDTVYIHDCPQSIEASKTEYFWVEGELEFYIDWNNDYCNIEYSFDKENWNTATPQVTDSYFKPSNISLEACLRVPANTKVYLRGVNGSTNSFFGRDWWGFIRVTTADLYNSNTGDEAFSCADCLGAELRVGGNVLSLVFGDNFVGNANSTVYSTLSKICSGLGMLTDASLLYINPAEYGTNTAWRSSNGNQWGIFETCHNLKKGPYIKYLKTNTFNECENLTDIYYLGDGSEITNTDPGAGFTEPEGGARWFNEKTSSNVETLTIHVKPSVQIPYMPANAVVVEDIPTDL